MKEVITKVTCDVCGSKDKVTSEKIQVIFTTEQTEGRACANYLSMQSIDLCELCGDDVLNGNYIFAHGAMGHNQYYFNKSKYGNKRYNDLQKKYDELKFRMDGLEK